MGALYQLNFPSYQAGRIQGLGLALGFIVRVYKSERALICWPDKTIPTLWMLLKSLEMCSVFPDVWLCVPPCRYIFRKSTADIKSPRGLPKTCGSWWLDLEGCPGSSRKILSNLMWVSREKRECETYGRGESWTRFLEQVNDQLSF